MLYVPREWLTPQPWRPIKWWTWFFHPLVNLRYIYIHHQLRHSQKNLIRFIRDNGGDA